VYSHPNVFGQCRKWLNKELPHAELLSTSSTAKAVEVAANEPNSAAIASRAAEGYPGMNIVATDIQDTTGNTTRFLIIADQACPATGRDKTSIAFSLLHKAGSLHSAIGSINKFGLNMTKIESRPSMVQAWE
ncbi:MAG: prephenate dehydratase, partial [Lentisphaerae bacterium]|nr:prephenate dehydratase [Lentisphaerota bacterium]